MKCPDIVSSNSVAQRNGSVFGLHSAVLPKAAREDARPTLEPALQSAQAKLLENLFQTEMMMNHDFTKDSPQCAEAERIVIGNGQVMFAARLGGQTTMGTKLPTNW